MNLTHEFFYSETVQNLKAFFASRLAKQTRNHTDYIGVFIMLLMFSGDGFKFNSCQTFQDIAGTSNKLSKLVWDFCIEHGILKESNGFFTALDWLAENGFLSQRQNRSNLPPDRDFAPKTTKDTGTPQTPPKVGQISQVNGIPVQGDKPSLKTDPKQTCEFPTETWPQPQKPHDPALDSIMPPPELVTQMVRPNVWIDLDQLKWVQERYEQIDIENGFDKLSDWKAKNNVCTRKGDFKQLMKWALDKAISERIVKEEMEKKPIKRNGIFTETTAEELDKFFERVNRDKEKQKEEERLARKRFIANRRVQP